MIERVQFATPMLKQLADEGYTCIDMHLHSKYSDTYTRPGSIVKLAAKRKIGVAITDHNHIQGCLDAHRENRKYNINLINGIELSTKEGPHLLIYFYDTDEMKEFYSRYVKEYKGKNPYMALKIPMDSLVEGAANYNSIISAAHPRSVSVWDLQRKIDRGDIDKSVIRHVSCAEVICGLILRKMNVRAVKWAFDKNLGITGGSDCHTLHKLGSVLAYSKASDAGSFLDSVKKKRNFVVGTETRIVPRMFSYSKALTKHSRYVGPSIMIHSRLGIRDSIMNLREKVARVRKK